MYLKDIVLYRDFKYNIYENKIFKIRKLHLFIVKFYHLPHHLLLCNIILSQILRQTQYKR